MADSLPVVSYPSPMWSLPTIVKMANKLLPSDFDGSWREDTFGLGTADEQSNSVTERTLFSIASNSKLFTAVVTGLIIENEQAKRGENARLKWTTKIKDIVPSWKLKDPVASEGTDVIDLLSHRTGLLQHDGFYGIDEDKGSLISPIRHLTPSAEFRQHWQYNNPAYMIASTFPEYLCDIALNAMAIHSGRRADAYVRKQMNFDACTDNLEEAEIRQAYRGNLVDVGLVPQGAMGAGSDGAISSAKDMATWLKTLLLCGHSPHGNKSVIPSPCSPKQQHPYQSPINRRLHPSPAEDLLGARTYGLAREMQVYRGHSVIEHGGRLPVQSSQVMRMPGQGISIVIMVNEHRFGPGFVQVVQGMILDRLLSLEPVDWDRREKELMFIGRIAGRWSRRSTSESRHSRERVNPSFLLKRRNP
ncbi:hypothetical protein NCC49_004620 [Naganishia albida]|nr:hypothetical protein NCC49_004620 [Naganishia albida]